MTLHVNISPCVNNSTVTLTNAALVRKYDLQERNPIKPDHDYSDSPYFATLTDNKAAAVLYIAVYEAKMANKQLLCMQCCDALGSCNHQTHSKFVALKDRSGLFKPTKSVVRVCEETEKCCNTSNSIHLLQFIQTQHGTCKNMIRSTPT